MSRQGRNAHRTDELRGIFEALGSSAANQLMKRVPTQRKARTQGNSRRDFAAAEALDGRSGGAIHSDVGRCALGGQQQAGVATQHGSAHEWDRVSDLHEEETHALERSRRLGNVIRSVFGAVAAARQYAAVSTTMRKRSTTHPQLAARSDSKQSGNSVEFTLERSHEAIE